MTDITTNISDNLRAALTPPTPTDGGWFLNLRAHLAALRHRQALLRLSDQQLRDIGLSCADIEYLRVASSPLIR